MAAEVIYATSLVPVKLSVVFLYRRIFPIHSLHIALWIIGIVVVSFGITLDFLAVFACVPVKGSWDPAIGPRCINFSACVTIQGSQNVVTDFALLCLPMPLIWKLHMRTSRKIQVSAIFILGGLYVKLIIRESS